MSQYIGMENLYEIMSESIFVTNIFKYIGHTLPEMQKAASMVTVQRHRHSGNLKVSPTNQPSCQPMISREGSLTEDHVAICTNKRLGSQLLLFPSFHLINCMCQGESKPGRYFCLPSRYFCLPLLIFR